jgi:hypothetical protein
MPVVLVDIYKKAEKIDLKENEKKLIKKLINDLYNEYHRRPKRRT